MAVDNSCTRITGEESEHPPLKSCSQIESAQALSDMFGYCPSNDVPDMNHFKYGPPSSHWIYHNADGSIAFYVARYDRPDGAKQFAPFHKNGKGWVMKLPTGPRPLYNLPALAANPGKPVLICEGEKACEAAAKISPYVCVTWHGGAQAPAKTDWTPLTGHPCVIWPDADRAGTEAGAKIAEILTPIAKSVSTVDTTGLSSGYDAADYPGAWPELRKWLLGRLNANRVTVNATNAAIQVNIAAEDQPIVSGSIRQIWEQFGIALSQSGNPIANTDNALRVLEGLAAFKGHFWFDTFHQKYFTDYKNKTVSEYNDYENLKLTILMQREIGLARITDSMVLKAVLVYAKRYKRDETRDWMDTLVWDKTPRIETFFIDCAGSPDNEYIRAASKNFFIAMVARTYFPGVKVDNLPILEGGQGRKKSTLLETIVSTKWHAEASELIHNKDFYQCLTGKLILEFADLSTWAKADTNKLKQIITCKTDRYRVPYDKTPDDYPRRSMFSATTNESVYLRDDTGGRRYWPIPINNIDILKATDIRSQAFAEAVHLYKDHASWWVMPQSTADEQEARRQVDPWEDEIGDFIVNKSSVSTTEIMQSCLRIEPAKRTRFDEMRIGGILRMFGWHRKQLRVGAVPGSSAENSRKYSYFKEPYPDDSNRKMNFDFEE